jgi:hypothetical protein
MYLVLLLVMVGPDRSLQGDAADLPDRTAKQTWQPCIYAFEEVRVRVGTERWKEN